VTETSTTPDTLAPTADAATAAPKKSGGGLGGKVLAELQEIAGGLGIDGAPQMRKGALIDAIKTARGENAPATADAPAKADKADAPAKVEKTAKVDPAAAVDSDTSVNKDKASSEESKDG